MKKAGILTFHAVPNYGAVLQTYGMQEYLRRRGYEVEVIDYRPAALMRDYRYVSFATVGALLASLWSLPSFWMKCRRFRRFRSRYLYMSAEQYFVADEVQGRDLDFLVLGSDQIWNAQITRGLNPVYFGHIKGGHPVTLSYAASIGKGNLTPQESETFRELLRGVDHISVREKEAKELLVSLTEREISVVLDPTLLVGADSFRSVLHPVKYRCYLFLYSLVGYEETYAMAERVAERLGLTVVELSGRRKGRKKRRHTVLYAAAPEDFLSLIATASFVVTDSFHGTAFSLLFHRRFITIPHRTRGGRMHGLLSECGLLGRLTAEDYDVIEQPIDWTAVDSRLAILRQQSESFLTDAMMGSLSVDGCDTVDQGDKEG